MRSGSITSEKARFLGMPHSAGKPVNSEVFLILPHFVNVHLKKLTPRSQRGLKAWRSGFPALLTGLSIPPKK